MLQFMVYGYANASDTDATWPLLAHETKDSALRHCEKARDESLRQLELKRKHVEAVGLSAPALNVELVRHEDVEREGVFDPWRTANTPDCDASYFVVTCWVVRAAVEDDPAVWEDETITLLRAEYTEQQLVGE